MFGTVRMASSVLAADGGSATTLVRLFLIAALLCVPYGIWLFRRDRALRNDGPDGTNDAGDVGDAEEADDAEADGPDDPDDTDSARRSGARQPVDLHAQLRRIEAFARQSGDDDPDQFVVTVADSYRLDGAVIAPAIAVALVHDTARQCHLVAEPGVGRDGVEAVVITRPAP